MAPSASSGRWRATTCTRAQWQAPSSAEARASQLYPAEQASPESWPPPPKPSWLHTAVAGTRMGSTGPPLLLSSGRSFGGKCSEYVLHFGSLINQQLFPAVEHMHNRAVAGGSEDEFYLLAPSSLESPVAFHSSFRVFFSARP